ncbi:RNA polymerase II associated protein 1 [Boothiomyces sp. JEL0866]|nr:RNA polymerase II associated protein 1 [Boothiomyces sp. JEL0866]
MISGDEELQALQKEFEKSKPSVTILKKSEKKSLFAQRRNIDIPAKIDSNSALFGTVLSNIKERNAEDSNAPVLKHPSGFPIAQHRSLQPIKSTAGIESDIHCTNLKMMQGMTVDEIREAQEEIYATFSKETIEIIKRNAAKKYGSDHNSIPSVASVTSQETHKEKKMVDEGIMRVEEEKKLEWTKEIQVQSESHLRFDFHGGILDSNAEFDSISGLYHHGDQPDKAGYTIEELIHLTKSTFPSQRALALQIISVIVKKIYSEYYSKESSKLIIEKLKMDNFVFVCRIGLDAKHETVYCTAITLLSVILGYENNGEIMNGYLEKLSLFTHKTISMELESQSAFKLKKEGENVEPTELENDMATILKLFQSDIILGLLLSNITTRIHYLLRIVSSDEFKLRMIYILTCIAQHSPSSSEDILATEGLVDTLSEMLFKPTWPAVQGLSSTLIQKVLVLLKILCQSSYESAMAITKSTLISRTVRFISIYRLDDEHLQIVRSVFEIFECIFVYGLSASIIDGYRSLFIEFSGKIRRLFPLDSNGNLNENSVVVDSLASFLNMLRTSLEKFRPQLDAGGPNDAYFPFIEFVVNLLIEFDIGFQNFESCGPFYFSALELIHVYFKQASTFQFQVSEKYSELLFRFYKHKDLMAFKIPVVPLISIYEPVRLYEGGVATAINKSTLDSVQSLLQLSSGCCILSSQLELINLEIQKYGLDSSTLGLEVFVPFINQILTSNFFSITDNWISIFSHGIFRFLESWISISSTINRKNKELVNKSLVIKCVNWYCNFALPGDDFTAHKLLTNYLLSKEWVGNDFNQVQQCFDKLYNIKSLSHSNLLTMLNPSKHPRSLMIQVQQIDQTVLPIQIDWLFQFPTGFKNGRIASVDEVVMWLGFILNFVSENYLSSPSWEISKLYYVMHIFFLSDNRGHEIYRDEKVNRLLGKLLDLLTENMYEDYNEEYLERIPNFFNLYQDFIDHFIATSFGDKVFARYIFIPLGMKFPHDFRVTFWTKLLEYYKFFDIKENELPGKSLAPFVTELDTNYKVILVYKRALAAGKLRAESILHKIASQYL